MALPKQFIVVDRIGELVLQRDGLTFAKSDKQSGIVGSNDWFTSHQKVAEAKAKEMGNNSYISIAYDWSEGRLTQNDHYWAGVVIRASNGNKEATRILRDDSYNCPDEIMEWFRLLMDLNIYCDSPESLRLNELSEKYENDKTYAAASC